MAEVKPNSGKLKKLGVRILSGLALVAFCGLPIYFGGWAMALLVLLFGVRVSYEWVRMTDESASKSPAKLAFVLPWLALLFALGLAWHGLWQWAFISVLIFAIIVFFERLSRQKKNNHNFSANWSWFGMFYVLLPSLAILWLRGNETGFNSDGFKRFFFILLVVIAADSFAYLGGSAIGGPKLAPKISPNKTWAGFFTGLFGGAIIGALFALLFGFSFITGFVLAIPIVLLAVGGDFLESWVKRRLGVKDAGRLLPGHGGLLDRIDSLLLAVLASALLLYFWPEIWPVMAG